MRKTLLLIVAILLTALALFCLLFALLAWMGYTRLMDGTAEMYRSYLQEAKIFLAIGLGSGLLAFLAFFFRARMR